MCIRDRYGGAAFVLIYLFFLIVLGLPIMVMEFAVGRASQKSIATSFNVLEKKGSKWHIYRYFGMAGNYLLMMFYTTIGGWMLAYFVKMVKGDFTGLDTEGVSAAFGSLSTDMTQMIFWMVLILSLIHIFRIIFKMVHRVREQHPFQLRFRLSSGEERGKQSGGG